MHCLLPSGCIANTEISVSERLPNEIAASARSTQNTDTGWMQEVRAPPGAGGSARARRPGASRPQTSSPPGDAPQRAQSPPSPPDGPRRLCSTWCHMPGRRIYNFKTLVAQILLAKRTPFKKDPVTRPLPGIEGMKESAVFGQIKRKCPANGEYRIAKALVQANMFIWCLPCRHQSLQLRRYGSRL